VNKGGEGARNRTNVKKIQLPGSCLLAAQQQS
jgi:hypothetical protein